MERHTKCPITHLIFLNPVLLHGDGITYEKQALEKWLKINKKSPMTGKIIKETTFSVNYSMKHVVEEYLKNNPNEKINQYVEESPIDNNTIYNILTTGTHDEIVDLMKDKKYLNVIFSNKFKPIHVVCIHQMHETIKYLIELGADYNEECDTWNPFHLVCKHQPFETIQYFVEELHCDVNCISSDGYSSMDLISRRTIQYVQYFTKHGVSLNFMSPNRYTVLHGACDIGNDFEVIKYFVDYGMNVNAKTIIGNTPFHFACKKQALCIINYLLKHGANPIEKNNNGQTPFDLLSARNGIYKLFVENYKEKYFF